MGNSCNCLSSPSTTQSITYRVSSYGGSHPKIDCASRPTLRDIETHVIPRVNTSWYNLGLQLLDPKYENELNTIEADTRNDAATNCRKMFSKWLNTDELASWDKLIKVFRIVQLNDVANDIEQLLLQGMSLIYLDYNLHHIVSVVVIMGGAGDHVMCNNW